MGVAVSTAPDVPLASRSVADGFAHVAITFARALET